MEMVSQALRGLSMREKEKDIKRVEVVGPGGSVENRERSGVPRS
jgi:hypothetical protein